MKTSRLVSTNPLTVVVILLIVASALLLGTDLKQSPAIISTENHCTPATAWRRQDCGQRNWWWNIH